MLLLILYVLIALVFSFLCSIAEAVILSINIPYIAVLEQSNKPHAPLLRKLKEDINSPLAAILTLNTIAHTMGAAGVGAQAATVFGDAYLGVASGILTLLILIFSEIIPKTLGAHFWRQLAPLTAYSLKLLIYALYPFVKLSEKITKSMPQGPTLKGVNRSELEAMAKISTEEGQLGQQESKILQNVLALSKIRVKDVMTPSTVVFSLPETMTVSDYFDQFKNSEFSRIPVYTKQQNHVSGFVLRDELLLAYARGQTDKPLKKWFREMPTVLDFMSISNAFDVLLQKRSHILLVVDEHGDVKGIITLEDVLETILGLEIVDESDKVVDMQKLARRLWRQRAQHMGLNIKKDNDL